jgi:hypothetical protein
VDDAKHAALNEDGREEVTFCGCGITSGAVKSAPKSAFTIWLVFAAALFKVLLLGDAAGAAFGVR